MNFCLTFLEKQKEKEKKKADKEKKRAKKEKKRLKEEKNFQWKEKEVEPVPQKEPTTEETAMPEVPQVKIMFFFLPIFFV